MYFFLSLFFLIFFKCLHSFNFIPPSAISINIADASDATQGVRYHPSPSHPRRWRGHAYRRDPMLGAALRPCPLVTNLGAIDLVYHPSTRGK